LALQPAASHIPVVSSTIEHTGDVTDTIPPSLAPVVEEGEITATTASNDNHDNDNDDHLPALTPHDDVDCNADDDCPDLISRHDDDSVSETDSDALSASTWDDEDDSIGDDNDIFDLEHPAPEPEKEVSPQPVNVSRFGRVRRPNSRYAYNARSYEWESSVDEPEFQDPPRACAIEAAPSLPNSNDALSWEPAPATIRDIVKMPNRVVKEEWLKSVRKELKTLVDSGTFQEDTPHSGKTSTPVMEIFKVKVKSDGSLDKLKTRLVVRGDLQDKNITEDKWSPRASFRSLKMFLGHASRLKARVKQLDFVGAFLQTKMRTRMFVTIPKVFGILFPEYAWCTGKPVRLLMSTYGTTLCGKYWYLDLLDFLKEIGFKEGDCVKGTFIKEFPDGSKIFLLNYVDDMLYFGTNAEKLHTFEKQLGERFHLELLGNAHWYLGSRTKKKVSQAANQDVWDMGRKLTTSNCLHQSDTLKHQKATRHTK
jgi:hypothetical protein